MVRLWSVAIAAAALAACPDGDRRFWGGPEHPEVLVLFTAVTTPATEVRTVAPLSSGRAHVKLGRTPLNKVLGAYVGDGLVFENPTHCLRYETALQFGEPMKEHIFEKDFPLGTVRVRGATGSVWCAGQYLGPSERPLPIAAGTHPLELRQEGRVEPLKLPAVEIRPGQETDLFVPIGR